MAKNKSKVDKNEKRKMPEDKAETPTTKKKQVTKVDPQVPMETDAAPDQLRVLERKIKKERKKEEKKLKKENPGETKDEPAKAASGENALLYLESFNKKQPGWKFQKARQTWLLTNMFDLQKVSDKHFKMMLKYLEGLKGSARETTVRKGEEFMKEYDGRGKREESDERRMKRIREVLQLLS